MTVEAEAFFKRAQQVRETGLRCLFLASLRLRQGDRRGSLELLRYINDTYKDYLLAGYARRLFYDDAGFESVRDDVEFLSLIDGSTVRGKCGRGT